MALLGIDQFAGAMPTVGHRELPKNYAVESINTWLYVKELRGVRPPVSLEPINPGIKRVFRVPKGTVGGDPTYPTLKPPPSYLGDSVWMKFDDPDTDIVKGVLINDAHDRFYFCSPSRGPEMNTLARMQTGAANYLLGTNKPTAALTVTVTGTSAATDVTRAYVYTYQSIYGEESAPSPPVVASGEPPPIGTWSVNGIPTPADELNRVPYKYVNLYRTVTSASGVATYFRIQQFDIEGTATAPPSWDDTVSDVTAVQQPQLETIGWLPPPQDASDPKKRLQGIVAMPNGFLVGWADSDIYFSVPYYPHAWPVEYIISTEYPIVGLGVFGNTCVVCTQGYPAAVTGVDPASTSLTKLNTVEPCLSRGSIVSTLNGVYYASGNGLQVVNASGVQNASESLIIREMWLKKYTPQYLRACKFQNGYLAIRCIPERGSRSAFYLDPTRPEVALTELRDFENTENVVTDVWSGEIFKVDYGDPSGEVLHWDPPSDDWMPLLWRSKEFQFPNPMNFGCYAIHWDQDRFRSNTHNTDIIAADVPMRFRVWANRVLIYDQPVPVTRNGKQMRLPSGFTSDIWQFEIRARAPVYTLSIAQIPRELAGG